VNDNWIVIPNWGKFQHYKNRNPAWIKVYTELNSDPNWEALTLHQRGLLVTIWIEYARSRGQVSLKLVQSWVGAGFKQATVKALSNAGFIELSASKPLALTRARERGTTYPKESASAPTSPNGDVALPLEEEKTLPPPEAVARVKALVETVFEK
jgi:hypothetical protein